MEKLNPKKNTVLVVDDEKIWRDSIVKLLKGAGYLCYAAENGSEAIRIYAKESPLVVLTDLRMKGDYGGMEVLQEVRRMDPDAVVILYTIFATVANAVEALKMGAFDYITKIEQSPDILLSVERATKFARIQRENRLLRSQMDNLDNDTGFHGGIGVSPAIKEVFEKAKRIAQTNATVFITGETGTGKEIIARGMHLYSPRRKQAYVPVAIASLPETLLEGELFGHYKGAFTGATTDKIGLFAAADQGTIFLDEICEVGLEMQKRLLRVLQEHAVLRLGGREEEAVDARIISATNKDPENLVREKKLREDLYYRLNVVRIHIPPLREHREDISVLAYHFLNKYRYSGPLEVESFNPDALLLMQQYDWPGNVRELQYAIERMVAEAQNSQIRVQDLPDKIRPSNKKVFIPSTDTEMDFKEAKAKIVKEFEKQYIEQMLDVYKGNICKMADAIGLNRKTIYRLMDAHNIKYDKSLNALK
jgi:DNA-binding NtrC family response regulator